jgi:conjugal transfer pilus assembly protein TraW
MKRNLFILLVMISTNQITLAKDFGKQGTTFEVKEEGFVGMMQRKLKDVDLVEHEQKMKDLTRKRIEEPESVEGITRATKTVSHSFDPTYILDEDVFLPGGKLLYPKGTEVNPLDHMTWNGKLIFIDSSDKEQVTWAVENYIASTKLSSVEEPNNGAQEQSSTLDVASSSSSSEEDGNKIVLIAGRPLDLEKEIGNRIYFDQSGVLTSKFNIRNVPAIVEQNGKYLKVTEINIKDKK